MYTGHGDDHVWSYSVVKVNYKQTIEEMGTNKIFEKFKKCRFQSHYTYTRTSPLNRLEDMCIHKICYWELDVGGLFDDPFTYIWIFPHPIYQ